MAFSIKNDEADELLRELTGLTGESLTEAVTESLRERIHRVRTTQRSEWERKRSVIDDIVARARLGRLPHAPTMAELDDWLYDEHGLPH